MTLKDSLRYVTHENSELLPVKMTNATVWFPNPERSAAEPGGELECWAKDGVENVESIEPLFPDLTPYTRVFRCTGHCYNHVAQDVLSVRVNAGEYGSAEGSNRFWDFTVPEQLKDFLLVDSDRNERAAAKSFEMDFEARKKERVYPTTHADVRHFELEGINWLYFVTCDIPLDMEDTIFLTPLSPTECLDLAFHISVADKSVERASDYLDFKQFLITDYLRRIKIERHQ